MNAGAGPRCSTCGGVNPNPQLTRCHYCGTALPMAQAYGAPPPGYGPAPQAYGAPGGYGPGPMPYGQNPYGQNPYGQVHGFGGNAPFQYAQPPVQFPNGNGWTSGFGTFFWVRLGIAAVAIAVSLLGACVNALSH